MTVDLRINGTLTCQSGSVTTPQVVGGTACILPRFLGLLSDQFCQFSHFDPQLIAELSHQSDLDLKGLREWQSRLHRFVRVVWHGNQSR